MTLPLSPQLHRRGFRCLHGVDGSAGMLERARSTGLYQELRLCVLGREPLPAPAGNGSGRTPVGDTHVSRRHRAGAAPEGPPVTPCVLAEHYDAVTVVGALGEGQVPSSVLPELLRVTKPGKGRAVSPPRRDPGGGEMGHRAPVDAGAPLNAGPVAQLGQHCCQGQAVHGVPDPVPCQLWAAGQGRRWQ